MQDMPPREELLMRAKTLHRRAWLRKSLTDGESFGISNETVRIGDVTIDRSGGRWTVTLRVSAEEYHHIYFDGVEPAGVVETGKVDVDKALSILRAAMILDDLARI